MVRSFTSGWLARDDQSLIQSVLSMVVGDLDIEWPWVIVGPFEADAPLLVDADAELTSSVAPQSLEMIAGEPHEIGPARRCVQDVEAPLRQYKGEARKRHKICYHRSLADWSAR